MFPCLHFWARSSHVNCGSKTVSHHMPNRYTDTDKYPHRLISVCVMLTFKPNHHTHLTHPETTTHCWWSFSGGTFLFGYLRINFIFKDIEWLASHRMCKVIVKFNFFVFVFFCMGVMVGYGNNIFVVVAQKT